MEGECYVFDQRIAVGQGSPDKRDNVLHDICLMYVRKMCGHAAGQPVPFGASWNNRH